MIDNNLKKEIINIIKICLIYDIILFVIIFIYFVFNNNINILNAILGLLIGFIISIAYVYHLAVSLNRAVDFQDEKSSSSYYTKQKLIRDLVVLSIFVIISKFVNVSIALFGLVALFGIKIGAYLSPLIKK